MVYTDSYTPDRSYYECRDCGYREATDTLGTCPECGGRPRNLAVPRD